MKVFLRIAPPARAVSPWGGPVARLRRVQCTLFSLLILVLAACGTAPIAPVVDRGVAPPAATSMQKAPATKPPAYVLKRGGGFYQDDGPGDNPPENLDAIPDASPRVEPLHRFANNPYTVLGRDYVPMRELKPYRATGVASWYGRKFHGQKTSSGEPYDMYGMTAAHPTLPIPSYVQVTSRVNGKSVVVRVNDRGPFHSDRIIDLSYTAASKLGLIGNGSGQVEVRSILPGEESVAVGKLEQPSVVARAEPIIPPMPPAETLVESSDAKGTWLQLGAFGNRDNAEAMKSRMTRELGSLGERLVVHPVNNLFRLQLGPWANAAEAQSVAQKIGEILEFKPVVVQR